MTRRRLWGLTGLVCALLFLPGLTGSWLRPVAGALAPDPLLAPHALVAGAVLLLVGALVSRRRPPRAELVLALSRGGRSTAEIARRTRLAQDAVRAVLGGDALAISSGGWGRIFRRRNPAPPDGGERFAEALTESAFEATS